MGAIVHTILNVHAVLAYTIVGLLVFAEDALFVGFVLPGETAAVLGGVVAYAGHVQLWLMILVVVVAAVIGDTVGYEIGKRFGLTRKAGRLLRRRQGKLARAEAFLQRHGGRAVFLGRFVAFFRAVMPALAGTARMPYLRFLAFNAAGGIVWGSAFVLLGFIAGNSYAAVSKTVGGGLAVVVGVIVLIGLVIWRKRKQRTKRRAAP